MRTKALATIAALAVTAFMAQAQVYSENIVGYVNTPLEGGQKYTLVANPMDDGTNTFASLLQGLPTGSQVLTWNGLNFVSANRVAFGAGWTPTGAQNTPLPPGTGAFIRSPSGSPNLTNTWVGEVLTGDLTNSLPTGFALIGNQAPVAGTVTDIGLTATIPPSPTGSQLLKWNTAGQVYQSFNRVAFGAGWTPSLPSIAVAEGFFVKNNSGAPLDWVQSFNP